jgi:hypothetical protein
LISFAKFIPSYFIVFEVIGNGIVSLISFSVCLLLVYGKATDFCMLILYPDTLLKEFMIYNRFLIEFWGSLRSSENRDSLTSSFPIGSLLGNWTELQIYQNKAPEYGFYLLQCERLQVEAERFILSRTCS